MPEFLWHALLAGLLIALAAGPLGSLMIWQRLAYFGDTLAHSALLGAALGLALQWDLGWTVLGVSLIIAALLAWMQPRLQMGGDTLLGILSHGGLALGLVLLSTLPDLRFDLNSYLFGDLLAVTSDDLITIAAVTAVLIVALLRYWSRLLSLTVHAELAGVEGLAIQRLRLLLLVLIALLVAIGIKVIGVLLITAMLIIPAAAARAFSHSPEQMALLAMVFGSGAVVGGLGLSYWVDTPAGPSVVVAAVALFTASTLKRQRR